MNLNQDLLNVALASLQTLKQDAVTWDALNLLLLSFADSDLEDAIANIKQASAYLEIDSNLRNVNPDGLPWNSIPGQLQRELDAYYLELALAEA
ncbi:hypothetical protein NIES2100_73720 [Calothrix sp. NIES-2100]|uniref:hypothetical protein n=1 Tax=Calothrix sp. NIES-2100 TaxID=1954172 RepID=UPI000B5EB797|nr:hypothetical protein NIES2100_73720 [Calothrix sp. NIES-2100]